MRQSWEQLADQVLDVLSAFIKTTTSPAVGRSVDMTHKIPRLSATFLRSPVQMVNVEVGKSKQLVLEEKNY
jgi:hypothetical protein